ncbi:MAG: hypothetical protein ABW185_19970 [Sedimenticola sp.]
MTTPVKKEWTTYSDTQTKAEILNQQFTSVFTREYCSHIPSMGPCPTKSAPPLLIQEKGVRKLLDGLNPHKASGTDQISTRFLKEMSPSISPALTLVFQASHDQGQDPEDWKSAPLFKKGDKSKPANYRPVSLTSVCCKSISSIAI